MTSKSIKAFQTNSLSSKEYKRYWKEADIQKMEGKKLI